MSVHPYTEHVFLEVVEDYDSMLWPPSKFYSGTNALLNRQLPVRYVLSCLNSSSVTVTLSNKKIAEMEATDFDNIP